MKWVTVTINNNQVSIAFDENSIHIYNAFPIKDDLKLRGYRWNPNDKSWDITTSNVDDEINILKNNLKPIVETKTVPERSILENFPISCSVLELRNRIDRLIQEGIGRQIWIRGVIASDIKDYKWASYFDLKDEEKSNEIFFRVEVKKNRLEQINRKLKESGVSEYIEKDLPVFCLVEAHLSLRYAAEVRLSVLDILPEYTQAKIRNQREITLEKLEKEGVLKNQKELIVPDLIFFVGLITSEHGTSVTDIIAGLAPYEKKYQFYFVDTRMEGANAVQSVIEAIDYLGNDSKIPTLDAIVIARGGGSEQSLSVFNDYHLCRQVCNSKTPIFTAIGHEKDISAIEICSFFTPSPSTPSGMGKYLQSRYLNVQQRLFDSVQKLINYFSNLHNREIEKIRAFIRNIPSLIINFLRFRREKFLYCINQLKQYVYFSVNEHRRRIINIIKLISSRSIVCCQKEEKRIKKTILKLDFQKRHRENNKDMVEIQNILKKIFDLVVKTIANTEKELKSLKDIVFANDPEMILNKGFTLTLDEKNRIIKSLREFKKAHIKRLKFFDGTTGIIEKEEK